MMFNEEADVQSFKYTHTLLFYDVILGCFDRGSSSAANCSAYSE